MTMILLQPKNPKGLKLHEAMEEKGLVLAVLSAGRLSVHWKFPLARYCLEKTIGLVNDKGQKSFELWSQKFSDIFSNHVCKKW